MSSQGPNTKMTKLQKRDKVSQTYSKNSTKIYTRRKRSQRRRHELMHRPRKCDSSQIDTIPEFTTEEIQAAVDRPEKRESERQQWSTRRTTENSAAMNTKEKIRTIFNKIVQQREDFTPKSWRWIRIQVIHKKG